SGSSMGLGAASSGGAQGGLAAPGDPRSPPAKAWVDVHQWAGSSFAAASSAVGSTATLAPEVALPHDTASSRTSPRNRARVPPALGSENAADNVFSGKPGLVAASRRATTP